MNTREEFIEELKNLGYKIIIDQKEITHLSYDDYYINLTGKSFWLNRVETDRPIAAGTNFKTLIDKEIFSESDYITIIKNILNGGFYNKSIVRNEKIEKILE